MHCKAGLGRRRSCAFRSASSLAACRLLLAGGVQAQDPNPLAAVKADRWAEAQAAAARFADPVAEKLVLYLRLRAPGAATASEIADFMQRNPDWPAQAMLERRRQEAIASDPDDAAVLAQCNPTPTLATAMLRCAEATANAGRTAEANALARQAWVNAIDVAAAETAFLRRWGGIADARRPMGPVSAPGLAVRPRRRRAPDHPAGPRPSMRPPRPAWRPNATTRRPKRWSPRCRRRCRPTPA